MAFGDVLAELAVKIGVDSKELTKGLDDANGKLEKFGVNTKKIGIGMTAAGGAIVGALGLATKAAAEEEAGIAKLNAAFQTMGISYNNVAGNLEKFINAQQVSTGYADDQQREALSALIPITQDYDESLKLLTLSMDLARWKGMDLVAASEIIGKVSAGNLGILSRYGIVLEEGADATQALAQIQNMAAGQAEAYGKSAMGQMDAIKNGMGDIMESIGSALLPVLKDLLKSVLPIIENFKKWAAENPELVKAIVLVVGAIGGLMTILGPILMMLPGIIAALPILGAAFAALTGPIGIAIAAIAALIAIGVLVWKNWDTIKAKASEIWGGIVNFFKGVWNTLITGFENVVNVYIRGINTIISWINKIPGINLSGISELNLSGIKAYASGGIVPGPIGAPQLAMVHGGEAIIPVGANGGMNVVVNIAGSVIAERDLVQTLRRELLMIQDRNYSTGIA